MHHEFKKKKRHNSEPQNYDPNCGMVVNITVEVNAPKHTLYDSCGGDLRLVEIKSNLNL